MKLVKQSFNTHFIYLFIIVFIPCILISFPLNSLYWRQLAPSKSSFLNFFYSAPSHKTLYATVAILDQNKKEKTLDSLKVHFPALVYQGNSLIQLQKFQTSKSFVSINEANKLIDRDPRYNPFIKKVVSLFYASSLSSDEKIEVSYVPLSSYKDYSILQEIIRNTPELALVSPYSIIKIISLILGFAIMVSCLLLSRRSYLFILFSFTNLILLYYAPSNTSVIIICHWLLSHLYRNFHTLRMKIIQTMLSLIALALFFAVAYTTKTELWYLISIIIYGIRFFMIWVQTHEKELMTTKQKYICLILFIVPILSLPIMTQYPQRRTKIKSNHSLLLPATNFVAKKESLNSLTFPKDTTQAYNLNSFLIHQAHQDGFAFSRTYFPPTLDEKLTTSNIKEEKGHYVSYYTVLFQYDETWYAEQQKLYEQSPWLQLLPIHH